MTDKINESMNENIKELEARYRETQDPAIKEMQKELFSRLIKPFFLPVLTLSLCILLLYAKENSNYKNSRIWVFLLGIFIIILTEFSESFTARNFFYFKLSIFLFLIIFFI